MDQTNEELRALVAEQIKTIDRLTAQLSPVAAGETVEMLPLPEPLEIKWPQLHSAALGCGIEDRNIRDRYEAAEYGWDNGVEKAMECVPEQIFDADQMHTYARAHAAREVAAKQAEIDRLMLEFCPNEMSTEQMANWEAHQRAAAPQQQAQAVAIPQGWRIRQDADGVIVVQKDGLGGYAAHHDDDNVASAILHALAADILTATPAAPGSEAGAAPAQAGLTDGQIIEICERECGWLAGAQDAELVKFARAILADQPAQGECRYPTCLPESEQQKVADEVAEAIYGTARPSQAGSGQAVEPRGWREFITNIATPRSEPLNSVSGYRDLASRKSMMGVLRATARDLLAAAPLPQEGAALAMLRYVLPHIPPRALDVEKARKGPTEDAYINTQVRKFLEGHGPQEGADAVDAARWRFIVNDGKSLQGRFTLVKYDERTQDLIELTGDQYVKAVDAARAQRASKKGE